MGGWFSSAGEKYRVAVPCPRPDGYSKFECTVRQIVSPTDKSIGQLFASLPLVCLWTRYFDRGLLIHVSPLLGHDDYAACMFDLGRVAVAFIAIVKAALTIIDPHINEWDRTVTNPWLRVKYEKVSISPDATALVHYITNLNQFTFRHGSHAMMVFAGTVHNGVGILFALHHRGPDDGDRPKVKAYVIDGERATEMAFLIESEPFDDLEAYSMFLDNVSRTFTRLLKAGQLNA